MMIFRVAQITGAFQRLGSLKTLAIGTLLGASALNHLGSLPSPFMVIAGLLLSGYLGIKYRTVGLLAVSLGFGWAYFHAHQRLAAQCPLSDCYRVVQVTGTVTGMTIWDEIQLKFELKSPQWGKVRLYWRNPPYRLKEGDKLTLNVVFSLPWRLANPGTFDVEKQLFKEGINATGTVQQCLDYHRATHLSMGQIRQILYERLLERYADKPLLPLIGATTLGLYGDMTSQQFEVFSATGTLHAIAISGSHIAMIAWLCTLLVTFFSRHCCWITHHYPAQHVGAIAGMLGALFYAALAGFAIPTQRALIMNMVALLALLQGKKILTWDLLAIAWLAVGFWDPLSTLDNGFWLSFGCVGILIYGQRMTQGAWWRRWILPQWLIFIGMIPFSVIFFQQIAWVSPIANMLTLPLLGFIAVPLSLVAVLSLGIYTPLADAGVALAHGFFQLSWWILEPLAALPLCLTLAMPSSVKPGSCRLTVLDVGQGLAVFVQTAHHRLLFDTGPTYGQHQDAGSRVIKPFFKSLKVDSLDTLIISHADLDHRGGWQSLRDFPIHTIYSSEPAAVSPEALFCVNGITWEWDGVVFTLLNANAEPSESSSREKPIARHERNNQSCILKVQTKAHSALLTGDIEAPAEAVLIAEASDLLPSDILVVPHHGSAGSSTPAFVSRVSPRHAIYPVGFHNRYRHPNPAVLAKYHQMGAENHLTHDTGALTFTLNALGELTPPTRRRHTHHRYWHRKNMCVK